MSNSETEVNPVTQGRNERRGMALAALIMSLVALLCAFIVGWRVFAIVVAGTAFIVGLFVLSKVRGPGRSKTMSVLAILVSLISAGLAIYYLADLRAEAARQSSIPAELHDTAAAGPDGATLDRLRMSMDSTQAGE